ncbi:SGNH/GDSL hydrolase family protein [Streptomyces sp. NPDC004232]|uniref:SGNH/GDSL hydrolase family protein n=1 Tax=Streptomyces sp. NPDC004232 TaxID=3154454 RepID=UPI001E1A5386|nr:SGNH/GDSL hydrolase family protein [Streptomyces sp. tea 10]
MIGNIPVGATTAQLRLFVLGDSIAGGSAQGGNGSQGWPALVANRLGLTLRLDGQGGSGYTTGGTQPGGRPYTQRVNDAVAAAPDLVVVEGSRNDVGPTQTQTAAVDTLRRLHAGLPHTRILVIGPIYSDPQPVGSHPVDEAVAAAAMKLGLPYLSAVRRGWFTGSAHQFIGSDGVHPTDAGHAYLAEQIRPELSRLLYP